MAISPVRVAALTIFLYALLTFLQTAYEVYRAPQFVAKPTAAAETVPGNAACVSRVSRRVSAFFLFFFFVVGFSHHICCPLKYRSEREKTAPPQQQR
jgi:hypothetical protein